MFLHVHPLLMVAGFPALVWLVTDIQNPSAWRTAAALAVVVVGGTLLLRAHWLLYRPEPWVGRDSPFGEPNRLVTHGPYRHIRHPYLVGIYLVILGWVVAFPGWLLATYLIVVVVLSSVVANTFERRGLERTFGAEYEAYRRATSQFVPRLF
ncbi:hypothetical protein J4H86_25165 [Spiractinospora alimapuensis]|uniref:methyltransferase family protein n=1 Tax=Spiractinospora alimapuensis TaxID=2820884 RepID=UPI001F1DC8DB|nr:methyltransferase [Spiractinospora alimapuensis]QVQ51988.1 hypothetical protein J4H86_25165 [Spiractinospora alimapuensis]